MQKHCSIAAGVGLLCVAAMLPAQAACLSDGKMDAVFDVAGNTLRVPVLELTNLPDSSTSRFVGLELKFKQGVFERPVEFIPLGRDCEFINAPLPLYDFGKHELTLPQVQIINGNQVNFFRALLQNSPAGLVITELLNESGENGVKGRYTGILRDQESGKPVVGATVSLNGQEAESPTNALGQFTVSGIDNEICQTLTVNAAGFEGFSMNVDIRFANTAVSCTR